MVEYHPISAKDQSRLHQFGAKVFPGVFLGYALNAGESGKETLWSQTLKNWRRWTHLNSTPEGSMQRKWKLHIPSRRWNSQSLWRRTASENIHLNPGIVQNEEKNKKFFKENQMNYIFQHNFNKTQRGMMRKLKVTSGLLQENSLSSSRGTQSQTVHA